jgi:hypothetical protein
MNRREIETLAGMCRRLGGRRPPTAPLSRGVITIYTCVMVLLLMASLLTYATYASMTEQRASADELRQKQAFHAAQAGIDIAGEWFRTQTLLVNADAENILGNLDGFLYPGAERWTKCADVDYQSDKTHPCWGDPNDQRRPYVYFYNYNGSTQLPIDTNILGSDVDVEVEALLCFIFLEDLDILQGLTSEILGCQILEGLLVDSSKFMITLLSRGQADCNNGHCGAQSLISQTVTNFSVGAQTSTPAVPLVTGGPLPTTGLLQLAANDSNPLNPLSIWGNGNASCGTPETNFDVSSLLSCPLSVLESRGGSCPSPTGLLGILNAINGGRVLSATSGLLGLLEDLLGAGVDLLADEAFPCDIFAAYFGVAEENWEIVRDSVTVINDCSVLDSESFGTYWVTGETCTIDGTVGSEAHPVMIISAASNTHLAEGAHIYGTLFVTDVEDATASLSAGNGALVQGQLISDSAWGPINGTATVQYDEDLIVNSTLSASVGNVQGSWTDFHKEWE